MARFMIGLVGAVIASSLLLVYLTFTYECTGKQQA